MADDTTASVIPLHQGPLKKDPPTKDKTAAARTKAQRQRKKPRARTANTTDAGLYSESLSSESLIPPEFLPGASDTDDTITEPSTDTRPSAEPAVTQPPAAAAYQSEPAARPPRHLTPLLLSIAAFALGAVGITINGWFARSLGSSDMAGWLFLAVGVAADLVALVMPSSASGLWQAGHRATALVGWTIWLMTFIFAVTAGIGFASTNISDVTLARASRVTPAVATAQASLADAMAARDRECRSGVGKFCRDREAVVAERRQILDSAMTSVGQAADPQTDAAIKLVTWVSRGLLRPAPEDFAMLRLVLLALLPQIGGILLMVGRHAPAPGHVRAG